MSTPAKIYLAAPLVGLAISLVCLALIPFPTIDPVYLKAAILLLLIPSGFAAVLMVVGSKGYLPFRTPTNLYSGCPLWMRRTSYTIIATGILSFVVAKLSGAETSTDTLVGTRSTAILATLGVVAFSVCFAQIYSAFALRDRS